MSRVIGANATCIGKKLSCIENNLEIVLLSNEERERVEGFLEQVKNAPPDDTEVVEAVE